MKVRIIMPVYNGEKYIALAIRSIIQQTCSDWELVIVDDGSTDSTAEIVSSFIDQRIKIIRQQNAGPEAARQAGFCGCTSQYVARMDADDEMTSDRLQLQVEYLDSNPDIVAVGGQIMFLSEDSANKGFPSSWPLSHKDIVNMFLDMKCGMCNATVMCRRDTQEKIEHTVRGGPGADVGFVLGLAKLGKIANLSSVVHHVRIHNESIQASFDPNKRKMRAGYSLECARSYYSGIQEPSWENFVNKWNDRTIWQRIADRHEVIVTKIARNSMWYKLNNPSSPKTFMFMISAAIIAPIRTGKRLLRLISK